MHAAQRAPIARGAGSCRVAGALMFAMLLGLPLAARAQSGSPVGTPLPPSASAQSSPAPTASSGDSLPGTWHTDAVTEADLVAAFVAGGGNETDGRDFFGQLGHFDSVRNTQYAVIGARFVDGLLTGLEGGDGAPEVQGGQDTYEVSADGFLTMTDTENPFCVGHYGITLSGDRLVLPPWTCSTPLADLTAPPYSGASRSTGTQRLQRMAPPPPCRPTGSTSRA